MGIDVSRRCDSAPRLFNPELIMVSMRLGEALVRCEVLGLGRKIGVLG